MRVTLDKHNPSIRPWYERLARCMRHCTIVAVALCVGLQGLALSADRALGQPRYHVHIRNLVVRAHNMHAALQQRNGPLNPEGDAAEGVPHHHDHPHRHLARHVHDPRDSSVVYADADDRSASHTGPAALLRSVHDLDGLIRTPLPAPLRRLAGKWPSDGARLFRSNVIAPPERPPPA